MGQPKKTVWRQMNIHKIKPRPLAIAEAVAKENQKAAQTQFGGGGVGQKNDAIVIENVDNGYIVRVVCTAIEQETVVVFTHEQRSDLLQFLAGAV